MLGIGVPRRPGNDLALAGIDAAKEALAGCAIRSGRLAGVFMLQFARAFGCLWSGPFSEPDQG